MCTFNFLQQRYTIKLVLPLPMDRLTLLKSTQMQLPPDADLHANRLGGVLIERPPPGFDARRGHTKEKW